MAAWTERSCHCVLPLEHRSPTLTPSPSAGTGVFRQETASRLDSDGHNTLGGSHRRGSQCSLTERVPIWGHPSFRCVTPQLGATRQFVSSWRPKMGPPPRWGLLPVCPVRTKFAPIWGHPIGWPVHAKIGPPVSSYTPSIRPKPASQAGATPTLQDGATRHFGPAGSARKSETAMPEWCHPQIQVERADP